MTDKRFSITAHETAAVIQFNLGEPRGTDPNGDPYYLLSASEAAEIGAWLREGAHVVELAEGARVSEAVGRELEGRP